MFRSRLRRQLATGLFALLCGALGAEKATAQQADEQAVKAGFIYNFIKFTQWGTSPEGDNRRLLVCTTADQPLGGQFAKLAGRTIGARAIEMRSNVGTNDWPGCDVLFIPQSDADRADAYIRSLGSAQVLTVGDFPGFTKAGGMIGLRMQDSRLRFDVNLGIAQRAGLQLNSQMLKLAGEVLK
jgi:hypothetical protein